MAGTTRRSPHEQRLTLLDARRVPKVVDGVQFVAHVNPAAVRFNRHRALLVTFEVPPEFREAALDLLYLDGVPLSVDVQRWLVAEHPSGGGLGGG